MYCIHCGGQMSKSDIFCSRCKTPVLTEDDIASLPHTAAVILTIPETHVDNAPGSGTARYTETSSNPIPNVSSETARLTNNGQLIKTAPPNEPQRHPAPPQPSSPARHTAPPPNEPARQPAHAQHAIDEQYFTPSANEPARKPAPPPVYSDMSTSQSRKYAERYSKKKSRKAVHVAAVIAAIIIIGYILFLFLYSPG